MTSDEIEAIAKPCVCGSPPNSDCERCRLVAALRAALDRNAELRAALEKIANLPIWPSTCLDNQMRDLAAAVLAVRDVKQGGGT